jgi:bifunctional DNA primase/polymerase-like protein/primase-like protein
MKNRMLRASLGYARRNWPVFPLFEVVDGRCACGDRKCQNPGKHPRTRRGFKDATTDEQRIEAWWTKYPNANIGIATGVESHLVVLDIDPRNGGNQSLRKFLGKHDLPRTPEARTGGKGSHRYLTDASKVKFKSRNSVLPGVDVKADGGYVVAPPSSHVSGRRYLWYDGLAPSETELAPVPSWLASQLLEPIRKPATRSVKDQIEKGARHDSLLRMAGALRRQGATPEDIAGALLVVNQNRCEPPLAEEDVQALAQSSEAWTPGNGGIESPYEADESGIFWLKTTKDGPMPVRLTNFDARIITDIVEDDGVETRRSYEIETKLLGQIRRFVAPAAQFPGMNWASENLGAKGIVSAGLGLRDHARAAVQELSKQPAQQIVFTHSGWRRYEGGWIYLHGDGAIGKTGLVPDVRVQLPSALSPLRLPAPTTGGKLKGAICASLKLLDLGPRRVTFPLFNAIWASLIGGCDYAVFLAGQTGVGKTEVAALLQQHFGSGFSSRNLPGSWSSTANANEGLAFTAKDSLLVLDDFAPTGTRSDLARYHKDADRILRAQGNGSGRARMRPDATIRPSKIPRGLILATGEDIPRGQSLRARTFVVEISPDDLDWNLLTKCQRDAAIGLYAQGMSAYLQWFASRYETKKQKLPEVLAMWRTRANNSAQHRRIPEIIAHLQVGACRFLEFARDVGAITGDEALKLREKSWRALGQAAAAQNRHQKSEDPVRRFLELIRSAISTGKAHLGDAASGSHEEGQGDCIGWASEEFVLLDPDRSFATAQKLAQEQGEFISVNQKTLWQRMKDRRVLAISDADRNLVKTRIGNHRTRVVALSRKTLGLTDA